MWYQMCFAILLLITKNVFTKEVKNYTEIATNEELEAISRELFNLTDSSLLSKITFNFQGHHKTSNSTDDLAAEPLLTLHDELVESDSIRYMQMLYDNYERNTSIEEIVTNEEMSEERNFIYALLQTAVMRRAMNFLESKSIVESNTESHFTLLKNIWFDLYPRIKGRNSTSSGFEHVFLSETKKNKLMGLHNWIYFAAMERNGRLNYKGWERIIDLGDKAKIIKIKFELDGMKKPVSSIFVGTQPELDISLYTICFKLRANRICPLAYDDVKFNVTAYSLIHNKRKYLGTAFVMG